MTTFSTEHFLKFCSRLSIDSKERGAMRLKPLGTQIYLINEIQKGLAEDVHTFVVLKARQLGISTISIALDLYWLFSHKGLQGALVTDTDENRVLFRSYINQYIRSLPASGGWKVAPVEHNRAQLVLKNRSRLSYLVAGTRKKGNLGAGKAINFGHFTECSGWGDEEGLASLMATLAEQNPARLYLFESTARGYNLWYEIWETAKAATKQRAIFIGWWRNELYALEPTTVEYKTYWDGALTSDEKLWAREIFKRYGFSVNDKQIAWWRWKMAEEMKDEVLMLQDYPPTEDEAFQLSGSKFFSNERINVSYRRALEQPRRFFRYEFGMHFEQTKFIECAQQNSELSVWEFPQKEGIYTIGGDPAYGSSEWADWFAISVTRCYADRVVQVAEFKTPDLINEQQFAWVLAHLAGNYNPSMVNLEMQGPGGTVFNELQNLKRYAGAPKDDNRISVLRAIHGEQAGLQQLYDVVAGIRDYFWRKQDTVQGGYAYQWQTTPKEKNRMMGTLRGYYERDMVIVNSPECVAQFRHVRREGDSVGGEGKAKDDMVIALALAVIAWNDWIMHEMIAQSRTYEFEMRPKDEKSAITPLENRVRQFFKLNGIDFTPRG